MTGTGIWEQVAKSSDREALTEDILATPLLREVGVDRYAFAHLSIQEYLAAYALARCRPADREGLFARVFLDPVLSELEVLPMALALIPDSEGNEFGDALLKLPESLMLTRLRLLLRSLAYNPSLPQVLRKEVTDGIMRVLTPYADSWEWVWASATVASIPPRVGERAPWLTNCVDRLLSRVERGRSIDTDVECAIVQIGGARAVEGLFERLREENCLLREDAVEALAKVGSAGAIDGVIASLQDDEESVRMKAITALGQVGGDQAEEALLAYAQDKKETAYLRGKATEALMEIAGDRTMQALPTLFSLGAISDDSRAAAVAFFGKIREERAVDALLARVKDDQDVRNVRSNAAYALARIGDARAGAGLRALLMDADFLTREYAAQALGTMSADTAGEALLAALDDNAGPVRARAAAALGTIRYGKAADKLIACLQDEQALVRSAAASALGLIRDGRAANGLQMALRDDEPGVRAAAAGALATLRNEEAVDGLMACLQDQSVHVRERAASALRQIGGNTAVNGLLALLRDQHALEEVRLQAARVLKWIESDRVVVEMQSILGAEDLFAQRHAAGPVFLAGDEEALEGLIASLRGQREDVRLSVAKELRRTGSEWAVDVLIALLADESWGVAREAMKSLAALASPRAVDLVCALLPKDFRLFEAVGVLGKNNAKAVDTLIGVLEDKQADERSRWDAARALCDTKNNRAWKPLLMRLEDPTEDGMIVTAAAMGLVEIGGIEAVPHLLARLGKRPADGNFIRENLMENLGQVATGEVAEVLLARMADPLEDEGIRRKAAEVLIRIETEHLGRGLAYSLGRRLPLPHRRLAAIVIAYYRTSPEVLSRLVALTRSYWDPLIWESASASAQQVRHLTSILRLY